MQEHHRDGWSSSCVASIIELNILDILLYILYNNILIRFHIDLNIDKFS